MKKTKFFGVFCSHVKARASKIPPYICTSNFHFYPCFQKTYQLYYTTATYYVDRHLSVLQVSYLVQWKSLANKMLCVALLLHALGQGLQHHPLLHWKNNTQKKPLCSFTGCIVCSQSILPVWIWSSAPLEDGIVICVLGNSLTVCLTVCLHIRQKNTCHLILVSVKGNWQCISCKHYRSYSQDLICI